MPRRRYGFGRTTRPRRPVWFVLGADGRRALTTRDEDLALAYALEGFGVEGEIAKGRVI